VLGPAVAATPTAPLSCLSWLWEVQREKKKEAEHQRKKQEKIRRVDCLGGDLTAASKGLGFTAASAAFASVAAKGICSGCVCGSSNSAPVPNYILDVIKCVLAYPASV
jgi:hypothetical protein